MNFTREPIIETIISPKEGCKLLVRSSKSGNGAEEYYVDALEVVSFGQAFFFRSMERPKAFLVPVSDYEILEVKETRVALKNVSHERNIKIGGGREARHSHREQPPQEREPQEAIVASNDDEELVADEATAETAGSRMDKRRDRRRRRHRRSPEDQDWNERRPPQQDAAQPSDGEQKAQGGGAADETKVSSQLFSSLIPPPTTLISETLSRYKDKEFMESITPKEARPKVEKKEAVEPESNGSESTPLHRVTPSTLSESLEAGSFSSTHFSPLQNGNDSYFF